MWFVLLLGAISLISVAVGAHSLAPWLPSFKHDLTRIFALAGLKPGERFYDLGSGDGRLVRYAAKYFGARAVGVEIALPLYLWSRLRQLVCRVPGASFRCQSFFKTSLCDADVVYVFGRPGRLGKQLVRKFKAEIRPGTRVISYSFPLEGRQADQVSKPTAGDLSIYLYIF